MKKRIQLIAFMLSVVALAGCEDDYSEMSNYYTPALGYHALWLGSSSSTFSSSGETFNNSLYAANTGWKALSAASWLTLSPTSGDANSTIDYQQPAQIAITADANTLAGDNRIGIITFETTNSDWNYSTYFTATQLPGTAWSRLLSEQTSYTVSGGGGTFTFQFETNDNWEIYMTKTAWDYVSFDVSKGEPGIYTVTGTIQPNPYNTTRTISIDVRPAQYGSSKAGEAAITVTQPPKGVEIAGSTSITIENTNVSAKFTIDADAEWTAASSDPSWLSVSPTSGIAGKNELTLMATANESENIRTGYINITCGYTTVQLEVVQVGLYILTAEQQLEFASVTDTKKVSVWSNTEWQASVNESSSSWLSVSPTSNSRDGEITVKVEDNPLTMGRVGYIYLDVKGSTSGNHYQTIMVTQEGKNISLKENTLYFGDDAGSQVVSLSAEAAWTATTTHDWITVSPSSGSQDATITVSVTENMDDNDRTGTVLLTMADKEVTLTIVQRGKFLSFSTTPMTFGSTGGTGEISIQTNDAWTAAIDGYADWLQLSKTSGVDSAVVGVTVTRNDVMKERSANVVITSAGGKKFSVTIEQRHRYLTASHEAFTFLGSGGTLGPLVVKCDGQFALSNKQAWLKIVQDGANNFYLTTTENSGSEQRSDTITVKCTDLTEGQLELKIPVRQIGSETSFDLLPYSIDGNWNIFNENGITVTLTKYATDKNWSGGNTGNSADLKIEKYDVDKKW